MNRILHLLWQIGDGYGPKGAFAHTDAAAHAQILGYEGLTVYKHNGFVARADGRTEVFAFFGALSWLASIAIDDCYPHVLPQLRSTVQVTSHKSTTMNST